MNNSSPAEETFKAIVERPPPRNLGPLVQLKLRNLIKDYPNMDEDLKTQITQYQKKNDDFIKLDNQEQEEWLRQIGGRKRKSRKSRKRKSRKGRKRKSRKRKSRRHKR